MNVSELFQLTQWIDSEIRGKRIVDIYQQLFNILQQNTQPNVPKQPFETQKNELIEAIQGVALDRVTKDQLEFLKKLGIADTVGDVGVEIIEDILYKNVIDVATSAQKLQSQIQKINSGLSKSDQIKSGLHGCVGVEEYEIADQILMRVAFTGHAAISNVTDFKHWGSTWYDIGRGITMAHGLTPEDVRIVGATKGSVIIELAVAYTIARTTSGIILEALKVAERVIEIKTKAEELRALKIDNDKIAKEVEKAAQSEKEKGVEAISATIQSQLGIKKDGEGDKVNALEKAIKNLVGFIENGGEVDFVMPEDEVIEGEEEAMQAKELRVAFEEIRKLEKKIELLEHKGKGVGQQ